MTPPSPRPHPKAAVAKLGVTSQKSASERITGQPDKAEPKTPTHQITWAGHTWLKSENPDGFAAAVAAKTGVGRVSQPEGDEPTDGGAG